MPDRRARGPSLGARLSGALRRAVAAAAERPERTRDASHGELAARSRRDFLLFGAGALATAAVGWWLLPERAKRTWLPGSNERPQTALHLDIERLALAEEDGTALGRSTGGFTGEAHVGADGGLEAVVRGVQVASHVVVQVFPEVPRRRLPPRVRARPRPVNDRARSRSTGPAA